MLVAAPTWDGRISPVLDVARCFVCVESWAGRVVQRREVRVDPTEVPSIAGRIASLGWDVLICGAVSRPLATSLRARGVTVIENRCGPVDEVLDAFVTGRFNDRSYMMPGCRRRGRRPPRGRGMQDGALADPVGRGRCVRRR